MPASSYLPLESPAIPETGNQGNPLLFGVQVIDLTQINGYLKK